MLNSRPLRGDILRRCCRLEDHVSAIIRVCSRHGDRRLRHRPLLRHHLPDGTGPAVPPDVTRIWWVLTAALVPTDVQALTCTSSGHLRKLLFALTAIDVNLLQKMAFKHRSRSPWQLNQAEIDPESGPAACFGWFGDGHGRHPRRGICATRKTSAIPPDHHEFIAF